METSEITIAKNNINTSSNKRKIMESTAILAGTMAVIPAGFLVVDNFSNNKKNYLKSVEKEKDIFEKNIQKNTDIGIGLLKKMNKPVNDSVIQTIRSHVTITEKANLDEKLASLKKLRKLYINKGLKIATGIGISIGTIVLATKNIYEKHYKQPTQFDNTTLTDYRTIFNNNLSFETGKKISFTGIVDKIAE